MLASATCAQSLQYVHAVHRVCTVSADCTQINGYVHSVYVFANTHIRSKCMRSNAPEIQCVLAIACEIAY